MSSREIIRGGINLFLWSTGAPAHYTASQRLSYLFLESRPAQRIVAVCRLANLIDQTRIKLVLRE